MTKLKATPVESIWNWAICDKYSREEIQSVIERFGKAHFTARDLLEQPEFTAGEKMWAIAEGGLLSDSLGDSLCGRLACDFARRLLPDFDRRFADGPDARACIEAKEKWLEGRLDGQDLIKTRKDYRDGFDFNDLEYRDICLAEAAWAACCKQGQWAMVTTSSIVLNYYGADSDGEGAWQVRHALEILSAAENSGG